MSSAQNIGSSTKDSGVAPTPQNTPSVNTLMQNALSRPSVPPAVTEESEDENGVSNVLDANKPLLHQLMQQRLQGLLGASSGYVEHLPGVVRRRVTALQGVLEEHIALENELQKALLKVEQEFAAKFAPLDERRKAIVMGTSEPKKDELDAGYRVADEDAAHEEEEEEELEGEDSRSETYYDEKRNSHSHEQKPKAERIPEPTSEELAEGPKGIPEFWLTAMKNHPGLAELITERDEEALKYLEDIRIEYPSKSGFSLVFEFSEGAREFFNQKTLKKTYYYKDTVGYEGDLVYDHAEGTPIEWVSDDKKLTAIVETKKQRNKRTNETRVVKKVVETDSFFEFFDPPQLSEYGLEDEDADSDLEQALALDYQVGEDLKQRIIPRAVDYFTGKALRFSQEFLQDDEEDLDYEDEDDEDDEDEDEDDDDEDEDGKRSKSKHHHQAAGNNQECKQQ